MKLNLNDPNDTTLERVSQFIGSVDDSEHRQIRVTTEGIAFMSDTVGGSDLEGIAFRLETFAAGNGYVGPKAAKSTPWVERVQAVLMKNWPRPTSRYIDQY